MAYFWFDADWLSIYYNIMQEFKTKRKTAALEYKDKSLNWTCIARYLQLFQCVKSKSKDW